VDKDLLDRIRSLCAMPGAVDRLCENMLLETHGLGAPGAAQWRPPTDVFECDEVYVIKMAVSGLRHGPDGLVQDAEVIVEDDTLVIRGSRVDHCAHTKRAFFQMELNYGRFERRVRITSPFDRDRIEARYADGFLEVLVPKAVRRTGKPRRIQVR